MPAVGRRRSTRICVKTYAAWSAQKINSYFAPERLDVVTNPRPNLQNEADKYLRFQRKSS